MNLGGTAAEAGAGVSAILVVLVKISARCCKAACLLSLIGASAGDVDGGCSSA